MGNTNTKNYSKKTEKKSVKNELSETQIEMLCKNTNFDRDQIIEWHKGFIKGL